CDGGAPSECATAAVDVAVAPVNDRPSAAPATLAISHGGASTLDLAALASDVETADADLAYEIVSAPARGDASLDGSTLRYERTAPGRDADELTYRVVDRGDPDGCAPAGDACDAARASEPATIALSFANRAPDASPEDVVVAEDERARLELDTTDPDGDALTLTVTTLPEHGTLRAGDDVVSAAPYELGTSALSYEPAPDFHGADAFRFTASDGEASDSAQVAIDVTPVNDAPVARGADASTTSGVEVTIPLVARDVDGDDLTFELTSPADHAVITLGTTTCEPDGGASTCTTPVRYDSVPTFAGTSTFRFAASDGERASEATVTVDVEAPGPKCGDPIEVTAAGEPIVGTECGELIVVHAPVAATIEGRGGDDTILVDGPAPVEIDAGDGDDRVECSDAITTVVAGAGDDDVTCGDAGDAVKGGAGNDVLGGGGGDDRVAGGSGDDKMRGHGGNDVVGGGRDRDVIRGSIGDDRVLGHAGVDRLQGGRGDDVIVGGDGDDFLKGRDGADLLDGGDGDDVLRGLPGDDVLRAGSGRNKLDGGKNRDTCIGGATGNTWESCERRRTRRA
ncbi:MAG TPA: Ig-like domain-containing protein, partial [Actinomycetota bacterium]|nr:Ig-like domain-containing protein [Actinomycetota bacterium]